MRFWVVAIGEPVPVGLAATDRLHRGGSLARFLAAAGHEVLWWTSAFDHFRKAHLFKTSTSLRLSETLGVRLLHGCGYGGNVSLSRILDQRSIARQFEHESQEHEALPDIVVSALPPVELCSSVVHYGRSRGVPTVLDMRDMWPDIFLTLAPAVLRPFSRLLLSPMFRMMRNTCMGATGIVGITGEFVDWGLGYAGRTRGDYDRDFPLAYATQEPASEAVSAAVRFWKDQGLFGGTDPFVIAYVGSMNRTDRLECLLEAASRLTREHNDHFRFVVCGVGDQMERFKRMTAGNPLVSFPGWIDAAAIYVLLRASTIGFDPLPVRSDIVRGINNKAVEYLSAGLPIISMPENGVLADLLRDEGCGLSFDGTADVLVRMLVRLDADRSAVRAMSEKSAALFRKRFAADRVYKDMMDHLTFIATDYKSAGSVS